MLISWKALILIRHWLSFSRLVCRSVKVHGRPSTESPFGPLWDELICTHARGYLLSFRIAKPVGNCLPDHKKLNKLSKEIRYLWFWHTLRNHLHILLLVSSPTWSPLHAAQPDQPTKYSNKTTVRGGYERFISESQRWESLPQVRWVMREGWKLCIAVIVY